MLKSPYGEETIGYYYDNQDMGCKGFGFNTADGGGFLPESHLSKNTEVTPIHLVLGVTATRAGEYPSLEIPESVAKAGVEIACFMAENNVKKGQICGQNFEANYTWRILNKEA